MRAIPSAYFCNRLQVASDPLTKAMTRSPDSASSVLSTITVSPSYRVGIIESPLISNPKNSPLEAIVGEISI